MPTWSQSWWRRARAVLVVVGLMLAVAVPVFGERQVSFTDARVAIASGDVWTVETRTDDAGLRDLSWSRGGITYVAPVDQAMESAVDVAAKVGGDDRSTGTPPQGELVRRITVWAHGINPEVNLPTITAPPRLHGEAFGWAVPEPLLAVMLLASFTALVMLVNGPQPRHATRWAWFWVFTTVPPLGIAVYLLLGARDEPAAWFGPARRRRLTGGPAFILTSIASTVIATAF